MSKEYCVTINATIIVLAENAEDAENKAADIIADNCGAIDEIFEETSIVGAELVEESKHG